MKKLLLFISLLVFIFSAQAQPEKEDYNKPVKPKKKFEWSKVRWGGTLGASLWGGISYADLSPTASYPLTDTWEVGAGPIFRYLFVRDYFIDYNGNYKSLEMTTYGLGVFTRYFLVEGLFVQAQPELVSFNYYDWYLGKRYRATDLFPLVGAGYAQLYSERSYFFILVLFNLNETNISPYPPNPIIRIGMSF